MKVTELLAKSHETMYIHEMNIFNKIKIDEIVNQIHIIPFKIHISKISMNINILIRVVYYTIFICFFIQLSFLVII